MLSEVLPTLILAAIAAFVTNGLARKFGFFKRPSFERPPIRFFHLLSVFGIFIGFTVVLPIFLQFLIVQFVPEPTLKLLMTLQFFIVLSMLLTLLFYVKTEGHSAYASVFKNPASTTSRSYDFIFGMMVWFIAVPWVYIVGQICDFILLKYYQFEGFEQVAVKYLKDNLESPFQMIIALLSIVVIAPIVEETLFRGTLQQYLKKFFSVRSSIAITALIFATFHFSASQGLGNFSLIPSLFVFACFLGYTYERQGSLYASIGLHMGFNLVSSLQILFVPS